MESINSINLLGHVGRDPELKTVGSSYLCTVNVATSRRFKDSQGEVQTKTTWHRCVAFGKQAETIAKYVKKGDPLYIRGRANTRRTARSERFLKSPSKNSSSWATGKRTERPRRARKAPPALPPHRRPHRNTPLPRTLRAVTPTGSRLTPQTIRTFPSNPRQPKGIAHNALL